jgi:TPR repeat protein
MFAGVCYADGLGVSKDEAKAVEWYSAAAAQGHAQAQFNLGMLDPLVREVQQKVNLCCALR